MLILENYTHVPEYHPHQNLSVLTYDVVLDDLLIQRTNM